MGALVDRLMKTQYIYILKCWIDGSNWCMCQFHNPDRIPNPLKNSQTIRIKWLSYVTCLTLKFLRGPLLNEVNFGCRWDVSLCSWV